MTARDDGTKSARQISRGKRRKEGDRSARLANALMKLSVPALKKLELDDELREAVERARAITALIARRRAERTLAGELRRFDMIDLQHKLAKVGEHDNADVQVFHLAEQWRARMIEEGIEATKTFPADVDEELPRLIHAAQRERTTGRPPGAARALFRHLVEALKSQRPEPAEPVEDDTTDDDDDDADTDE